MFKTGWDEVEHIEGGICATVDGGKSDGVAKKVRERGARATN